ncbi:MAG: prolyl oligopeptidase family serine peptidase [Leptospiraceae bacterium]|nr:prolyl oligopeptidase family serine peptidase [Leptospiraceae bacterium]
MKSKKLLVIVLVIALLPEFILFGASWYFSGLVVHFNKRTLEEDRKKLEITGIEQFGLKEPETISIELKDTTLKGWFFASEKPTKKCGVILLHGISGTRFGAIKYAPIFLKRNCSILVYDARRHGESSGEANTYGHFESDDLLKVAEFFKTKTGLTSNQVGIFGESYGAATSIIAASKSSEFAFVGADSPYQDLPTIIRERALTLYGKFLLPIVPISLTLAGIRGGFEPDKVSPKESAKGIKIPVFLSHSESDVYTLPYHSEAIFGNIPHEKKRFFKTDWGAAHAKSINTNRERYEKALADFLNEFAPAFQ